jgi:hypothetical protein
MSAEAALAHHRAEMARMLAKVAFLADDLARTMETMRQVGSEKWPGKADALQDAARRARALKELTFERLDSLVGPPPPG